MSSIFDRVTAFEILGYAGHPVRNPKRNIRCPFHDDRSPSCSVFERGFYCFGCGRKGGLAALVIDLGYADTYAEAACWLEQTFR